MTADVLIVGQGLAGTTLAWRLLAAGVSVAVLDAAETVTSSRIAAGLITPITGQRLAKTWRLDELWPVAVKFYQQLESELQTSFFHEKEMVRFFQNAEERRTYAERAEDTFAGWVAEPSPPLDQDRFHAPLGAFEMPRAAQLNTAAYVEASRQAFRQRGCFWEGRLQSPDDLEFGEASIRVRRWNITCGRIIFCEGAIASQNEFFRFIRFQPAKGEILTVRIPDLQEHRIIHHGVWLVPQGEDYYRVGATFQRDRLDTNPTESGRAEILAKLRAFIRRPVQVIDHQAAVRPVIDAGRPLLGTHPDLERIGFFNGLGAKGSLLAPYFAAQMTDHLTGRGRIDSEVRLGLPIVQPAIGPRLTEQAQLVIRAVLRPGDLAIDATTGNGRDTRFLAETVGPTGFVHGFDLQATALARTATVLESLGLNHVQLHCHDHAEMALVIPAELHGKITAVMFNLGYLPGGDKSLITHPDRSVPAVRAACELLRVGGICTIMAYVGHDGGPEECAAIRDCIRRLPPERFDVQEPPERGPANAPKLLIIRKRNA